MEGVSIQKRPINSWHLAYYRYGEGEPVILFRKISLKN